MENLASQFLQCTSHLPPPWKSRPLLFSSPKTLTQQTRRRASSAPCHPPLLSTDLTAHHTTLLVETFHEQRYVTSLLQRLRRRGSCPIQLLLEDGDWTTDHFWVVVRFLHISSRAREILPVFDAWKKIEGSRINESNYEKIICLLCKDKLINAAIQAFNDMKHNELNPTVETYNSIIQGYAHDGKFEEAMLYLNQMKENGLSPVTETYKGLIEAYGKYKVYDGIVKCLKRMESDGFLPNQDTYNLLIREFSRGGLLRRMEKIFQSLMSRKMALEPSTLTAMLEAYAEFGSIEKMEETYKRVSRFGFSIDAELVRKIATIYIDNLMFSRLEDLGLHKSSKNHGAELGWCLRLLSHALLLSQKGLDSVVGEMEEAKVPWNTTIANILLLAYSKIGNFNSIKSLVSELGIQQVKPDLVTVGIILDLSHLGFDSTGIFMKWKEMGILDREVEMNTDPLVHAAFGKGRFLKNCEDVFCSLDPKSRESKSWTYQYLMELVVKYKNTLP